MALWALEAAAKLRISRGSLRKLKSICRTLVILFKILKEVQKDNLRKRNAQLAFFDKFMVIYDQVAIGWVKKCVKKPLITLFTDKD